MSIAFEMFFLHIVGISCPLQASLPTWSTRIVTCYYWCRKDKRRVGSTSLWMPHRVDLEEDAIISCRRSRQSAGCRAPAAASSLRPCDDKNYRQVSPLVQQSKAYLWNCRKAMPFSPYTCRTTFSIQLLLTSCDAMAVGQINFQPGNFREA